MDNYNFARVMFGFVCCVGSVIAVQVAGVSCVAPVLLPTGAGATAFWVVLLFAGGIVSLCLAMRMPHAARFVLSNVGVIVSAFVVSSWSVVGYGRFLMVNPNIVAAIIALSLPFTHGYASIALCIGALLVCGSRGAVVSLAVGASTLVMLKYWRDGTLRISFAVLCIVAVCVALIVVIAVRPNTVIDRINTWKNVLSLVFMRPFLGYGAGASMTMLGRNHVDLFLLTVAFEFGFVGVALSVVACVVILRLCFSLPGEPARLAVLACLIHQFFDATLYMPFVPFLFGAALGLLILHYREVRCGKASKA